MNSTQILFLFVASSFFWSCFDLARKKLTEKLSVPLTLWILMLGQIPLYASFFISPDQRHLSSAYWFWGFLGLLVNFAANSLFIISVSISSFLKTVPMLSFTPVFSVIFSSLLLGESLSYWQMLGLAAVVMGAFMLNGWPSIKGDKKGPFLMQMAALAWGLMGVIDKKCLQVSSMATHTVFQTSGLFIISSFWCLYLKEFKNLKNFRNYGDAAIGGVFSSVLAVVCQLYVLKFVLVPVLEAAKRGLGLFWTVLIARLVFSEDLDIRKLLSLGVMGLGLYWLLAGI